MRDWRPRRFGGGLGGRKPKKSKKEIAADEIRALAARGQVPERRPDRDRGGDRGRSDRGGQPPAPTGDRGPSDRTERDRPRNDRSGLGYRENENNSNYGGGHYGPPSGSSQFSSQSDRKRPRSREREDNYSPRGGSNRYNDDRGRGDPESGRYERRRRSRSPERDRGRY